MNSDVGIPVADLGGLHWFLWKPPFSSRLLASKASLHTYWPNFAILTLSHTTGIVHLRFLPDSSTDLHACTCYTAFEACKQHIRECGSSKIIRPPSVWRMEKLSLSSDLDLPLNAICGGKIKFS